MSNTEQFRVTAEYLAQQGLSPTFPARFFSKIRFTESCWIWTGCIQRGYGLISARSYDSILAHRASWILHFGPIPNEMSVCHDCPDGDNPSCVNPAHLWLGTMKENITDASNKGRLKNHGWKNPMDVPNRKLDWESITEIRRLHSSGTTAADIAIRYNVHRSAIYGIVKFHTWKIKA